MVKFKQEFTYGIFNIMWSYNKVVEEILYTGSNYEMAPFEQL